MIINIPLDILQRSLHHAASRVRCADCIDVLSEGTTWICGNEMSIQHYSWGAGTGHPMFCVGLDADWQYAVKVDNVYYDQCQGQMFINWLKFSEFLCLVARRVQYGLVWSGMNSGLQRTCNCLLIFTSIHWWMHIWINCSKRLEWRVKSVGSENLLIYGSLE